MQAAYKTHKESISIAGVVSGPDESVDADHLQKTVQRLLLSYPQVRDRDTGLTELFHITGTPEVIVLDRDRKVVYRGHSLPESLEPYL